MDNAKNKNNYFKNFAFNFIKLFKVNILLFFYIKFLILDSLRVSSTGVSYLIWIIPSQRKKKEYILKTIIQRLSREQLTNFTFKRSKKICISWLHFQKK